MTSCKDWASRLQKRQAPVNPRKLPLRTAKANEFSEIFSRLKVADIEGQPYMGDLANFDWLDQIGRALFGGDKIKEALALTPKKQSKCLPLDTEVVTPAGFSLMRDLQPGDMVVAPDGKPTRVIGKSPVHIGNECFEIEFSTGEVIVADADHRWWVEAHTDRERSRKQRAAQLKRQGLSSAGVQPDPCWGFKTTRELAAKVVHYANANYTINEWRTAVPDALDLPEADLPLDPYILGYWLGDGTTSQAAFTVGQADRDDLDFRLDMAGFELSWERADPRTGAVTLRYGAGHARSEVNGVMLPAPEWSLLYKLRAAGVADDKHIPAAYLRGSIAQRRQLLNGLLDSDGTGAGTTTTSAAVFSSSKKPLADGVFDLACSLGFKPVLCERRATLNGEDKGPIWTVQFTAYQEDQVFSLARKNANLKPRPETKNRSSYRSIVRVEPCKSVPVQCIKVESETEQFLIGRSCIPTGNTSGGSLLYLAAFLANDSPHQQFTVLAPTVGIANFAFDQIRGAIEADPDLSALTHVKRYQKQIEHRISGAMIQVKPASLQAVTGLKGSVFVDELHVWGAMASGQKLRQQLKGALAVNKQARGLYITTQSDSPPAGLWSSMLNYARDVRDGKISDPAFLPVLYEPWKGADPWTNESIWPCLLPSYPHIADRQFYLSAISEAKSSGPSAIAEAKSQYFNIQIGQGESGTSWDVAAAAPGLIDPAITFEDLLETSARVAIGVDLGGAGDLTSLTAVGQTGTRWRVWTRAWLTPAGRAKATNKTEPLFTGFEDDGDLHVVEPGEDTTELMKLIEAVRDSNKLVGIGIDPAGAADLVDALEDAGFEMDVPGGAFGVGQTAFRLAPAQRSLSRMVEQKRITFADQRLMMWALANVNVVQKGNAPAIEKANVAADNKIDPVMALLDAVTVLITQREEIQDPLAMIA